MVQPDHPIHLEIFSRNNLLWIVAKYQEILTNAKDVRMEKYSNFQEDLQRKNAEMHADSPCAVHVHHLKIVIVVEIKNNTRQPLI